MVFRLAFIKFTLVLESGLQNIVKISAIWKLNGKLCAPALTLLLPVQMFNNMNWFSK